MTDRQMTSLAESMRSAWARARIEGLLNTFAKLDGDDEGQATAIAGANAVLAAPGRRAAYRREEAEARARVLEDVASDLRLLRADIRARSNRSFLLLMVFSCLFGVSVLVTIGLGITGAASATSLSGVGALLSGGAATGFWRLYVSETRRADTMLDDLQRIEEARVAYLLASPGGRDTSRGYIIESLPSRSTNENKQ